MKIDTFDVVCLLVLVGIILLNVALAMVTGRLGYLVNTLIPLPVIVQVILSIEKRKL